MSNPTTYLQCLPREVLNEVQMMIDNLCVRTYLTKNFKHDYALVWEAYENNSGFGVYLPLNSSILSFYDESELSKLEVKEKLQSNQTVIIEMNPMMTGKFISIIIDQKISISVGGGIIIIPCKYRQNFINWIISVLQFES